MRIAYIVTTASPIGGAQIHVRDLAAAAAARGHQPAVLTGGNGVFIDDLHRLGIPVRVMRHLSVPIHPLEDLRALREIRGALTELRPDLIAAHSSKAGILGRLAGRSLKVPVVFTVHGWAFTPGVPPLHAAIYRQAERLVGPLASRIITVSEFDRRLGLAARIAGEDRLVTVHNGMPDMSSELLADPERIAGQDGDGGPIRGTEGSPHAVPSAGRAATPAWELDLIGDGPLMSETEALAGAWAFRKSAVPGTAEGCGSASRKRPKSACWRPTGRGSP